ncbi:MAG: hypothetical protein M3Z66_16520 [Chloroflexota bacterium]|nr:hypothetical protein [Chloroflexota bacterium]
MSHCQDSGEDVTEAFGDPLAYAASLAPRSAANFALLVTGNSALSLGLIMTLGLALANFRAGVETIPLSAVALSACGALISGILVTGRGLGGKSVLLALGLCLLVTVAVIVMILVALNDGATALDLGSRRQALLIGPVFIVIGFTLALLARKRRNRGHQLMIRQAIN